MVGEDLKLLIPAALNATYLNSGTLGPTPSAALAAAAAGELEWVEAGAGQHSHYIQAKHSVRKFARRVEKLMPGGTVSITENNSESLLRVLWGTDFQVGDEIITTSHEHGAVVLSLSSIMRRFGVKVHVVDVDNPVGLVPELVQRLNDHTRLVVMSHVSYLTGWELPVAEVASAIERYPRCRLLVDGAQALGNIVVDPERLGADFYVFCGHKWMMAPAGWAGLWVRASRRDELFMRWPKEPERLDARVLTKGPLTDFSDVGDDLEYGTRCWPRIAGWSVTWDYFEEDGFQFHADYQRALADEARDRLSQIPDVWVQDPPPDIYGKTALMTVGCRSLGSGLSDWLLERGVMAKANPQRQGIRLSWASFNTIDDLERLSQAIRELGHED